MPVNRSLSPAVRIVADKTGCDRSGIGGILQNKLIFDVIIYGKSYLSDTMQKGLLYDSHHIAKTHTIKRLKRKNEISMEVMPNYARIIDDISSLIEASSILPTPPMIH